MATLLMWMISLALAVLQAEPAPVRFDYLVRQDFFAGFAGDDARLARAMEICEKALADDPTHPEALVWHGSGLVFRAGRSFAAGDRAAGAALWAEGMKQMDTAAALAPDDVGVLVPRGAMLLVATRNMPPDLARPLLESAVNNYEHVLAIQAPVFATLGDHPKGELLFGLAEGYYRLGDSMKTRMYFERLIADAPGSGHTTHARGWLETGSLPKTEGLGCVGCHK